LRLFKVAFSTFFSLFSKTFSTYSFSAFSRCTMQPEIEKRRKGGGGVCEEGDAKTN
jgi:hypothetical protein